MNTQETIKEQFKAMYGQLSAMRDSSQKTAMLDQFFTLEQYAMDMFKVMKGMKVLQSNIDKLPADHLFAKSDMFIDGKDAIDTFLIKLNPYL